jgi:hypothetical protein
MVGKQKQYRVSETQSHKFFLLCSNLAFNVRFVKFINDVSELTKKFGS